MSGPARSRTSDKRDLYRIVTSFAYHRGSLMTKNELLINTNELSSLLLDGCAGALVALGGEALPALGPLWLLGLLGGGLLLAGLPSVISRMTTRGVGGDFGAAVPAPGPAAAVLAGGPSSCPATLISPPFT